MSRELHLALIERAVATIVDHADELTSLDQAIGDGDHGVNMRRGFEAIAADKEALAALPAAEALHKAGMLLVMKVGGASGPLYGSLLIAMAKTAGAGLPLVRQLEDGIAMVRQRGRSDVGAKTMLDVLVPVLDALKANAGGPPGEVRAALRRTADQAREATFDMLATRGRAAYLGLRSRGHYDPGASSSRLLVHAVCDALDALA
jgi:dihydroxyacetone kinase-like protein